MKKFIKKVGLMFFGLFLINMLCYMILHHIYYDKYEKVDTSFNSYLLSDSHGTPLLDELEEKGIYNFSFGGDSYNDMFLKINYLIKKTKVDTILISVESHSLSPYREKWHNLDKSVSFSSISQFDNSFEYLKKRFFDRYLVVINPKSRSVIKLYVASKLNIFSRKIVNEDFSKLSFENKNELIDARFKEQFPTDLRSNKLFSKLDDIIKLCKTNDIVLIGVIFPLTKTYINKIGKTTYKADKLFKDNSLKVIDFKNLFIDADSLFRDPDHLNKIGGKIFSNIFKDSLKQN